VKQLLSQTARGRISKYRTVAAAEQKRSCLSTNFYQRNEARWTTLTIPAST
jgi:hypothetical protein